MKYYYDLHLHSCLSPCSENDMTPANLVGMAALAGLNIIALTDHNSCKNCAAAIGAGKDRGVCVIPGMELTTSEEVHVLLLFPRLDSALECSGYVGSKLPRIANVPDIYGDQLIYDAHDRCIDREPRLLATAAQIGIYETVSLAGFYHGVAIPAHIDRPSFSLLSNLGLYDKGLGFRTVEVTRNASFAELQKAQPALNNVRAVRNSDAHALETIWDAEYAFELASATPEAIIAALS